MQNLEAKKGMTLLKEEGRIHEYQRRGEYKQTEKADFKNFIKKGSTCSNLLKATRPDIVERLNQEVREEKEIERKKKEKEKKNDDDGQWNYNGESGEYYWTGPNEPEYGDNFSHSPPTEEEKMLIKEAEKREFEWYCEERKNRLKEKRKQKENELKEAMANPMDPLPQYEMGQYEKLREDRIKERERLMAECGFFDDLMHLKKDMVTVSNATLKESKKLQKKETGKPKERNRKENTKTEGAKEINTDDKKVPYASRVNQKEDKGANTEIKDD